MKTPYEIFKDMDDDEKLVVYKLIGLVIWAVLCLAAVGFKCILG